MDDRHLKTVDEIIAHGEVNCRSAPALAPQAAMTADVSSTYYTSSYHTATYWYPASCSGWQSLSKACSAIGLLETIAILARPQ
jgi:hypothetical protein